jgi:hypothetical protein
MHLHPKAEASVAEAEAFFGKISEQSGE